MRYQKLAELYRDASATTKRLEKIDILSDFLKSLSEKDREVMYLLLGDIYPEYDERRIGISNQLAIKAISKATGTEAKEVTKQWKSIGDIGEVAEKLNRKWICCEMVDDYLYGALGRFEESSKLNKRMKPYSIYPPCALDDF